jgi:hypothetical protein
VLDRVSHMHTEGEKKQLHYEIRNVYLKKYDYTMKTISSEKNVKEFSHCNRSVITLSIWVKLDTSIVMSRLRSLMEFFVTYIYVYNKKFILHNRISSYVIWFHKNVYLSDKIWIQLKPLPFLSCRFLEVHISPTRTGELTGHHPHSPIWVEGIHMMGCCPVPQRDRLGHCYHHLSAMQLSARCLTPWLQWTRALFTVLSSYPFCN